MDLKQTAGWYLNTRFCRSRATAKNRRNYVDDALENLETQNKSLTEILEETRHLNQTNEERLKQIEEDNMHLRQLLDEVTRHCFLEDSRHWHCHVDFVCQYGAQATHGIPTTAYHHNTSWNWQWINTIEISLLFHFNCGIYPSLTHAIYFQQGELFIRHGIHDVFFVYE